MKTKVTSILLIILLGFLPILITPNSFAQAGGTSLIAEGIYGGVTVTAHYEYVWTIDKSVSPTTWNLFTGDTGTSHYTITVTKSATPETWVDGQICVTNDGAVATVGLAITADLIYPPGGPSSTVINSVTVDVSGNPVLDPSATYPNPIYGEQGCYNYMMVIPSANVHLGQTYKVTAHITILNHSGFIGTAHGPNPSNTDTLPSSPALSSINVDDTNGGSWPFSTSDSVTYDKTFACDADAGPHSNTATIREPASTTTRL